MTEQLRRLRLAKQKEFKEYKANLIKKYYYAIFKDDACYFNIVFDLDGERYVTQECTYHNRKWTYIFKSSIKSIKHYLKYKEWISPIFIDMEVTFQLNDEHYETFGEFRIAYVKNKENEKLRINMINKIENRKQRLNDILND